jgi:hypothetical protein
LTVFNTFGLDDSLKRPKKIVELWSPLLKKTFGKNYWWVGGQWAGMCLKREKRETHNTRSHDNKV